MTPRHSLLLLVLVAVLFGGGGCKAKEKSKDGGGSGGSSGSGVEIVVGKGQPTCKDARACRVYLGKLFKQPSEAAALKKACVDRSGMSWNTSGCRIDEGSVCVRNHGTTAEYFTAPDFGLPDETSCTGSPGAKWVAADGLAPTNGAEEFFPRTEGFQEPTKRGCYVGVDGQCIVSAVSESCSGPAESVPTCPTEKLLGACYQAQMPDSELTLWTYYYPPYTAPLAEALCGGAGGSWK